jgi:membrane-associated phospholipid phosphatase
MVLALTGAVLAFGILPGEQAAREAVVARASALVMEMAWWANYGGTWRVLVPAMLVLLGAFPGARRRWWLWYGILVVGEVLEEGAKLLVARPRPDSQDFGFPSGHATAAAAFSTTMIYLVSGTGLARAYQLIAHTLAVLPALAVGSARVVLRAHWPADVVAGLALGAACAAAGAWWDATHPLSGRR